MTISYALPMMKASPMFFIKGKHLGFSSILISQKWFMQGKYARSISLNSTHIILLKQRDLGPIELLGRQLCGRDRAKTFLSIYKRDVAVKSYGYLLAEECISTHEIRSLRSNIANDGPNEVVYSWREWCYLHPRSVSLKYFMKTRRYQEAEVGWDLYF